MKRIIDMIVRAALLGCLVFSLLILSGLAVTSRVHAAGSPLNMGKQVAAAYLGHAARGSAQLDWSSAHDVLTVTLSISGLQAKSVHPVQIHAGDCSMKGAIIYTLHHIVANAAGNAVSKTVISSVKGGIPAIGWYINVYVGPTLSSPKQAEALACGNIVNSNTATSSVQSAIATLSVASSPNQSAYGLALLRLRGTTLTVYTTVYHLVPGSSHMEHIHVGSCEYQAPGNVLYPLSVLTANAKGIAVASTTIQGISAIPVAGWYINIHYGIDLSTQFGYDPIDCGNVNLLY